MDSNDIIKQAVMAGMGVTLLSQHTIGWKLAAKRLIVLDIESPPVMRRGYIPPSHCGSFYWRKARYCSDKDATKLKSHRARRQSESASQPTMPGKAGWVRRVARHKKHADNGFVSE